MGKVEESTGGGYEDGGECYLVIDRVGEIGAFRQL